MEEIPFPSPPTCPALLLWQTRQFSLEYLEFEMGYSWPGTFPSSSLSSTRVFFFFLFFRVCGVLTKEAELLNPAETFLAEQRGGDAPRFAPVVTFNWEMGISGWSLKLQING